MYVIHRETLHEVDHVFDRLALSQKTDFSIKHSLVIYFLEAEPLSSYLVLNEPDFGARRLSDLSQKLVLLDLIVETLSIK